MRLDNTTRSMSSGIGYLPSPAIPQAVMPAPTTMIMPGMVVTAQTIAPDPQPDLTPQDLLKPLPAIVDNQPVQIAQCNSFAQWVDANPVMAGLLLVGLAMFTFHKGGGR